jgi:NhaP-type Na+/H+ or K+/H+ antiporter
LFADRDVARDRSRFWKVVWLLLQGLGFLLGAAMVMLVFLQEDSWNLLRGVVRCSMFNPQSILAS